MEGRTPGRKNSMGKIPVVGRGMADDGLTEDHSGERERGGAR